MDARSLVQTVILGIIALAILVPTGFVAVYLVEHGQAGEAIALIGPLAGAAGAFFFQHQSFLVGVQQTSAERTDLLAAMQTLPLQTPQPLQPNVVTVPPPSGPTAPGSAGIGMGPTGIPIHGTTETKL